MQLPMSDRFRRLPTLTTPAALLAALMWVGGWLPMASAATNPAATGMASAPPAASAPAIHNSALDDQLFYEMLVGEMALNEGDAGSAYQLILDAARRSGDDGLYRHAVDIALQRRAGDQALAAARAWRTAKPQSPDPVRVELQILVLLNRAETIGEPLKALLALTPAPERPALIDGIPRLMDRATNPAAVATVIEATLKPYLDGPTGVSAHVAIGRTWLLAHDPDQALDQARKAQALDAKAAGPALLALQLLHDRPQAEGIVLDYLGQPGAEPELRMAYVRELTTNQRYAEAIAQLEALTRQKPELAQSFLTLGALELELRNNAEGEAALVRYLDLVQHQAGASQASPASSAQAEPASADSTAADSDVDADNAGRSARGMVQAWLMLAQSAEQRGDYKLAETWLSHVTDPQEALEVQTRRASILIRQGRVEPALDLIRQVPEHGDDDVRAKFLAEASVLRDGKQWRQAFDVLGTANQRFSDDTDLLYEQAMMAEKLNRMDDMERLLDRVIELKPDNAQARNALGYSLADRKMRLPEALKLIQRALELTPGDPFITDSLGWVEYRMGHGEEALRLLQEAYNARPDPEIAAHLGEVLWSLGKHDEARHVWREARVHDATNDVLRETLTRLRVEL